MLQTFILQIGKLSNFLSVILDAFLPVTVYNC